MHCGSCAARVQKVLGRQESVAGALNPIVAGGAMALSSVSVVTNSLRLYRFRKSSSTA